MCSSFYGGASFVTKIIKGMIATMNQNMHFVIVGAQRSGTTYLYEVLNEHPEICMSIPLRPEPKYFIGRSLSEVNIRDYFSSFFQHCDSLHTITGEKSTSYYELEESARLLSATLPDTKILFILRDPVKRALSNYFFSYNNGLEFRSLSDVFIKRKSIPAKYCKNISVNPFNYLERGRYVEFIEMYQKYFSLNQINVIIFEEFVDSLRSIQALYGYLGVDGCFIPETRALVVNASKKIVVVDAQIENFLTNYYKPLKTRLENLLNKELNVWA